MSVKNRVSLYLNLFVITLMFITSVLAHADGSEMTFRHMFDDPAAGEVQEFLQDRDGYFWVGGRHALLRYNAYEFLEIPIEHPSDQPSTLRTPQYTREIFQDSTGKIWVASHSGLFWFDANRGVLKKVTTKNGEKLPIYSENIHTITELPSGDFILGLSDGYAVIDKETLSAERHTIAQHITGPSPTTVHEIIIDKEGTVWIGARTGLFRYNYKTGDIARFIPDPSNAESQVDNSLVSIAFDKKGHIWGGTLGGGIYIFNPKKQYFLRLRAGRPGSKGLSENTAWKIIRDSRDNMWLAHDRNGLSKYDPIKDRFKTYMYVPGEPGSPLHNAVRAIYEDRNGDFWLGHYPEGVSFHDSTSSAIQVYVPNYQATNTIGNENVLGIMEDASHNLWLTLGDRVDYYDRKQGHFKHYSKDNGKYPTNGSLTGHIDKKQQVWIGTWNEGYHKYNPDKDLFETQPVDASLANTEGNQHTVLSDSTVWAFCETSDGHLWIGTHYAGISRYNSETGIYTRFNGEEKTNAITNNVAWVCHEDKKKRLWVGTAYGLNQMTSEGEVIQKYYPQDGVANKLQTDAVLSIHETNSGQLWFGTDGGLLRYREATDDFEIFTKEHGFSNHGIRAMTSDHDGLLWLGTNSGIIRFNPESLEVKNYLEHAGTSFSGINSAAAITSNSGEVIFGSTKGLIIIDAKNLAVSSSPPPVVWTGFSVFTKPVGVDGPDQLLTKVINKTTSITLDYTKKMFSFEFSALNYRNSKENEYAYKLDGFDQEWREIGTNRKALYTNLSAGSYTFRVRASNNDGVWNMNGASIDIEQLPPPWKTWWAYVIYSALILSIIVYVLQAQKRKRRMIEEQNRQLEIKVTERTKDLASKNKDIQTMLSNMQQGLFTIEESGEVHHEYSAYLESIYETKDISGQDAVDFMFDSALIDNDIMDQITVSLFTIIDMDAMNYDCNSHLLVTEYQKNINGRIKILSVDWSPIIEGSIVAKLMVSVRDVTQLKALELEAEDKKRELIIIGQLLNVNAKEYEGYALSSEKYLNECIELLNNEDVLQSGKLNQLFRNMHTIKGNSRTHGFTHIANAAHDAESIYSQLKDDTTTWDKKQLLLDLERVRNSLGEYQSIYRGVLGRADAASGDMSGIWVPEETLHSIQCGIEKLKPYDIDEYKVLQSSINRCLASPLVEVFSSNLKALPSIAEELGKEQPRVRFINNGILVKNNAGGLLRDVFTHLIRNAIDHGIEAANERAANGKDPKGTITVEIVETPSAIDITITDDGRGLDLERLFRKGVESNKWQENNQVSITTLSNLIFESGMSTKEEISDISGRGVGMDAVKQFLIQAGGDITLEIVDGEAAYKPQSTQVPTHFLTRITLPKNMFVTDTH